MRKLIQVLIFPFIKKRIVIYTPFLKDETLSFGREFPEAQREKKRH